MSTAATTEQCHSAAGKLMQHAGGMDVLMCNALRIITKLEAKQAKAILFALDSVPGRKKIIMRSVELLNNKEATKHADKLCEACSGVYKQRNTLAHAIILLHPDKEGLQIHSAKHDHSKPLTVEYLDSLLSESVTHFVKGLTAHASLCQTLGVPSEPDF